MIKPQKMMWVPTLGALGVVFGDIGTSPLYAFQAAFEIKGHHMYVNQLNVLGLISLIIWSITIVVSIKFLSFIMRYGNQNEGGIMALISMLKSGNLSKHKKLLFIGFGLIGAALFYGDGVITPAISVLSAVEGVKVITPHLNGLIVPLTLVILAALFWVQKYGTALVGELFGPIMLVWFVAIGAAGVWQISKYPHILYALLPYAAVHFFVARPLTAFVSMSAVVLAVTGAEALYADMGHFGRQPIAKAWYYVVFPALALCYLGQGGMILRGVSIKTNLLVQMFPDAIRIPVVILATLATIIASQAVISGVFSITRQAIQLNFLPKMLIRYTSLKRIGQIYIPFVNAVLFILVTILVLLFKSSSNLINAYGIAVSGTLLADTVLFIVVAKSLYKKPNWYLVLVCLVFLPLDLLFITSNAQKIFHGGLFPVIIALAICTLMYTWIKGDTIVENRRKAMGQNLQAFVSSIHSASQPLKRIPGAGIYIGHHTELAPLALLATVEDFHELPEKVVIVTIKVKTSAHVPRENRAVIDSLRYSDGISHVTLSYGYHDAINVPEDIRPLIGRTPELDFNLKQAAYFISQAKIIASKRHNLAPWRKSLFRYMYRNALSEPDYYQLPLQRTEEMQTLITL